MILTIDTRLSKDKPMNWKPRGRKLFMFTVPEQRKIRGSVLYQANVNRGHYSKAVDCWVVEIGPECRYAWSKGQHCLIDDGFEAEPTNLDMWEECRDLPEFTQCKAFVEAVEGVVKTSVIHEESIIGLVE